MLYCPVGTFTYTKQTTFKNKQIVTLAACVEYLRTCLASEVCFFNLDNRVEYYIHYIVMPLRLAHCLPGMTSQPEFTKRTFVLPELHIQNMSGGKNVEQTIEQSRFSLYNIVMLMRLAYCFLRVTRSTLIYKLSIALLGILHIQYMQRIEWNR